MTQKGKKPGVGGTKSASLPAFLVALAKFVTVSIADPELSELTEEDRVKLRALEAAWKKDGDVAFERFSETDFHAYAKIVGALNPRAMREAKVNYSISE
jgi:hypothetical protein